MWGWSNIPQQWWLWQKANNTTQINDCPWTSLLRPCSCNCYLSCLRQCQHLPVSPTPARTEASATKGSEATTALVLKDSRGDSAELVKDFLKDGLCLSFCVQGFTLKRRHFLRAQKSSRQLCRPQFIFSFFSFTFLYRLILWTYLTFSISFTLYELCFKRHCLIFFHRSHWLLLWEWKDVQWSRQYHGGRGRVSGLVFQFHPAGHRGSFNHVPKLRRHGT